jgi:hypothetical protein
MFEAKEDKFLTKGTWSLWKGRRRPSVLFACPKCAALSIFDEKIQADGLTPKPVQCLKPLCTFYDSVKLIDWKGRPKSTWS